MFIKYPKVKRLGHEDTDGILMGTVYVEEKIDGANASIWLDENGEIQCGSRTRQLKDGFNGFVDYARSHEGIREYLTKSPRHRLYGEWLVRHTISYNETAYKHFYLFDILVEPETITESDDENEDERERLVIRQCSWLPIADVKSVAELFNIRTPRVFGGFQDPTPEQFDEFVGKTDLGLKGEGVVLKNPGFINKWGDRVCAKVVTQEFKEDNALVFGGNNKHSETYVEQKMVNEFMTLARVKKVMQKIEPTIQGRLDMEHTSRIIQTAYHDMFEEELWTFAKKHKVIDFGALERLSMRKAAKVYHDILNGHESVAYAQNTSGQEDVGEF